MRHLCENGAYVKTLHFQARQQQRHISDERVWLALGWGQVFYQGREKVYFLGRKQIGRAQKALGAGLPLTPQDWHDADGTVVVVGEDGALVTTYRSLHDIRRLRRCAA